MSNQKNFKKLLLTLIICFSCCLVAMAETQTKMPVKNKGFFSNYFEKAKTWGHSYKTQLETKYFEDRIKKTPDDVELLKTYAKFLKDHNHYNESIKIYERIIDLTKNNAYKKDIDETKSLQRNQINEKLFLDYIKQAQKYESQGNIVKANEYYLKAKKIYPERYEAKFGLAKTYCWLNQPKFAIKNYQKLLKQSPDNIDLLEAYAGCLTDNKKYTQAKEIYKKLLALTKNEKYKKNLQDIISLEKGYTPKLSNAELAQSNAPNSVFLNYIRQAQQYESQGKIAKANEYYLKAEKIYPNRYEAKFGLAKTYGWLHQKKLALAYYKELLKESPNNPDLTAAYNKFLKESKGSKSYQGKTIKSHPIQNINAENDKTFSKDLRS